MQTRQAVEADLQDLFVWRNNPQTRQMSFDAACIALPDHEVWFKQSLSNPERVIVIGLQGGRKIGMVRYDREGRTAVVGINLNPAFRGRGLAARLLVSSEALIPAAWQVEALEAKIKAANPLSLRAFERAGYRRSRDTEVAEAEICVCRKHFAVTTATFSRPTPDTRKPQ